MNLFEVDTQTCNKDGICVAVCPMGIIEMQKGEYPTPTVEAEELCIRCGHCVAVCPTGSISHREMSVEKCPHIEKESRLSISQCEQFLRARRSIRTYKEQSVPRSELLKLIDLARYAPTGRNSQSVEWLVLGNRDELRHLAGITVDWMRWILDNMTEVAVSLHLDNWISRWEEGKDVIFRDAPAVIVTHAAKDDIMAPTSSTIALSYSDLAATAIGLGCCWGWRFPFCGRQFFFPMMEALPLPENHVCLGAMMVGYPKFSYHRLPVRKQPAITWRL